ncbi:Uncharacterised protein [Mycobacterium tuberculosis]|nr:Uncharacterised protein [Mycobacterium tuberculosis]
MASDTSSAPAAATWIVGAAAAAVAALIADRMPAKSVAAAASISGFAITNDMAVLPSMGRRVSPITASRLVFRRRAPVDPKRRPLITRT